MDDFEKNLDDLNLRQDVIVLGYVDDETLRWLYQNCFAFVYPSLFEGFGLPVMEAMSLGAPVIASDVSSIPEIVGQAGILIDPANPPQLMQGMRSLQESPERHRQFKEQSLKQASQFSWKVAASTVLELYEEVLSRTPLFPGASIRESMRSSEFFESMRKTL